MMVARGKRGLLNRAHLWQIEPICDRSWSEWVPKTHTPTTIFGWGIRTRRSLIIGILALNNQDDLKYSRLSRPKTSGAVRANNTQSFGNFTGSYKLKSL